jgi:trk system potassium uptake protein TrkA
MQRIGIIGAGRFGMTLAESLTRRGCEVVLLDRDPDTVQRAAASVAMAAQGDAEDVNALTQLGMQECDAAVVAIGDNMEGSILACMNLLELEVKHVVAKAISDIHGRLLERLGVHELVYPNRERAQRLARSLLSPAMLDYFSLGKGLSVAEVEAPAALCGKPLAELKVRNLHQVNILAIKRAGSAENLTLPSGEDEIFEGDTLVVCSTEDNLLKFS